MQLKDRMKNNIVKLIKESNKIVFFHHEKPDGDALSSSYALLKGIQKTFPDKEVKWVADKNYIENRFPYLNVDYSDNISDLSLINDEWLGIIGDCSNINRIFGNEALSSAGKKACFDHHRNDIDFECDAFWHEPTYPASAIQSYEIAKELKIEFDAELALQFVFGILTDTGNFKYSLNDTRPLQAATELFEFVDRDRMSYVYNEMNVKTKTDIAVQGFAFTNYVFNAETKFAYCLWTKETMEKLQITEGDAHRPNILANVEGAEVWAFFVYDAEKDKIKCELRSTGKLAVNEIAAQFGGGGHIPAAGATIEPDWKIVDKVIEAINNKQKEILNN